MPVRWGAAATLLLLAGCPAPEAKDEPVDSGDTAEDRESGETQESGDSADTTESGESGDSDSDGWYGGTGGPKMWIVGHVTTSEGALVSAELGIAMYDLGYLPELRSVCSVVGPATETAALLPDCAACDWAFDLVVSDSVATGAHCGAFGLTDGWMDGYGGGFGWADLYEFEYAGVVYPLTDTVFYYLPSYGQWALVGYNYADYGYNEGDAADGTFNLPLNRDYYFYP